MVEASILDQILNFIMPPAVFIFLGWTLYMAFKKPVDQLIAKYKEWKENRRSGTTTTSNIQTIQYE